MSSFSYEDIKHFRVHSGPNDDGEICYYCELCLLHGESKPRNTLYYNIRKRKGKCFRCGSTIHGGKRTLEDICEDYMLGPESSIQKPVLWDISKWSSPVVFGSPQYVYLKKRGITDEMISIYGTRQCDFPYKGVVIPNGSISTSVNFFQIRTIESNGNQLRYVNPSSLKPVFGDFLPTKTEAVISEGPLSSMSTYSKKYTSYGLYGKEPSSYQLSILKELPVERYSVCLDGGESVSSLSLVRQILSFRDEVSLIMLPVGKDPNDMIQYFNKFYDNRCLITKDGLSLLDGVVNAKTKYKIKDANERKRWEVESWGKMIKVIESLRKRRTIISCI